MRDKIAPMPKKIPALFQLPMTVLVIEVNKPKDKKAGPKIILKIRNRANIMEDNTKAKKE